MEQGKIELTEREIEVINMYLNGEVGTLLPTDVQETMMAVISKAETLEGKLDAYDEVLATEKCDLIRWFWGKYSAQQ